MQKDFYFDLSDEVVAVCDELLWRAAEWNLSIKRKKNFVGVRTSQKLFLFWIARRDGIDYFKARRCCVRDRGEDIVCLPLTAEHAEQILASAEESYRDYTANGAALCFEKGILPHAVDHWRAAADRAVLSCRKDAPCTPELCAAAGEFSSLADALLQLLLDEAVSTPARKRNRELWEKYVLCDERTLRDLAPEYEVTHERIRQYVNKCSMRLEKVFQKYCLFGNSEEVNGYTAQMITLLDGIGDALIPFLTESFGNLGKRKRAFMLRLLFGEGNGKMLEEACEPYQKAASTAAKIEERALQETAQLQKLIRYPTEVYADTQTVIRPFVLNEEYEHVARFRRRLERCGERLRFVQNPDIVYCAGAKAKHRPHFMLELENGRRVLVLVRRTIDMALSHSRTHFRALHEFCKQNGYGYLITDGRGQTPFTLQKLPIDEKLTQTLNGILTSRGEIDWGGICEIKKSQTVTNEMIAAYVLQNKLQFFMKPYFRILT